MNGYASHGLDEDAFGEKSSVRRSLRTFDAFRKFPTRTINMLKCRARSAGRFRNRPRKWPVPGYGADADDRRGDSSEDKTFLYSAFSPRRAMDGSGIARLYLLIDIRVPHMAQRHREAALQR